MEQQDQDAMMRLRRMITPFILRRLKKEVLADLPDKLEEAVYARMEEEQQQLYTANVQNLKRLLNGQTDAQFREKSCNCLQSLPGCDRSVVTRCLYTRIIRVVRRSWKCVWNYCITP